MLSEAGADDLTQAGQVTLQPAEFVSESGVKVSAQIGRLAVPENRLKENSNVIELAFVKLQSTASRPGAPLVYLAGGPGGSCTWMPGEPSAVEKWLEVLEICDVVFLDQRGTGQSTPSLAWRGRGAVPADILVDPDVMRAHTFELHGQARDELLARGIDLEGYTTVQSADDLSDLRIALGAEKLSLMGFSYGSHLGLATIRRHGRHIENAILIGVEGPDHTYKLPLVMDVAFRRLADLVAQDEVVGPDVPDLVDLLDSVLFRLEEEPMVVELHDRRSNRDLEIPVGPEFLKAILRRDIGDAEDLPVFPRLLHSIDSGDPRILQWFVQKRIGGAFSVSGMSMMMDGSSGASNGRLALIEEQNSQSLFAEVVTFPYPDINEVWNPADVGGQFRSPLVSDVRTLFLTGSLDFNTPPHQAAEVRWGFANSTHLTVENAGHEQVLPHPKIRKAAADFLRGKDVSEVHATWPPLKFVPLEGFDPERTHPSVPRE
jgi:pimeloyl-ACP methyl ester carboxylesterase